MNAFVFADGILYLAFHYVHPMIFSEGANLCRTCL